MADEYILKHLDDIRIAIEDLNNIVKTFQTDMIYLKRIFC